MTALPVAPEWEPVLGSDFEPELVDRDAVARRGAELSLMPLRWPAVWPPETLTAMLAATYAKQVGRAVAYSLAAFRQAFAAGRDLGDQDTVLLAAAAAEMHPVAVLKALRTRAVTAALANAGARARAAGVDALPAIDVGSQVFSGAGAVERASAALARR
jgi:predicted DsbA family dithiol-disulfide isomerase